MRPVASSMGGALVLGGQLRHLTLTLTLILTLTLALTSALTLTLAEP